MITTKIFLALAIGSTSFQLPVVHRPATSPAGTICIQNKCFVEPGPTKGPYCRYGEVCK